MRRSPPPRLPFLRAGCRGSPPTCRGRRCAGDGAQHCPFGLYALSGAACRGGGGRPSREGWPSTVVMGIWCQVLSLPWPPVPWGRRPGFRVPWSPRAVGVGMGTLTVPRHALLRAVIACCGGGGRAFRGGGTLRRCEGRLSPGALPPPAARPLRGLLGSATQGLWCGFRGRGDPALFLWLACPAGGQVPRGWWEAVPRGWPSPVVRGVWCQALSLPRPPIPWAGQQGFRDPCLPDAVCVGVGTQLRPRSVGSCEPSLRALGVAGGRPGGPALRHCEGRLSSGALPPPAARLLGGLLGSATRLLWPRVRGRGGPAPSLWSACPAGGCMPRGWWEAVPEGVGLPPL